MEDYQDTGVPGVALTGLRRTTLDWDRVGKGGRGKYIKFGKERSAILIF